jgi:Na+-translocating ferredoxin:NAD+ oxidoreductase RnfD subunit
MELQRRAVLWTVGSFSRLVTSFLNTSAAENLETLVHLVHSRPALTPLLTVSNHVTTSVLSLALPVFFPQLMLVLGCDLEMPPFFFLCPPNVSL